jgi:hypothetical protein
LFCFAFGWYRRDWLVGDASATPLSSSPQNPHQQQPRLTPNNQPKHKTKQKKPRKALIGAGIGVFVPNSVAPSTMLGCRTSRDRMDACSDLIEFMFYGWGHLSSGDDFVALAGTWPSTVSLRNLYHWGQLFHRGGGLYMYDFGTDCGKMVARGANAAGEPPAARDWGESCNQAVYGQEEPPGYDLSSIRVRAAVFEGEYDLMATPKDVAKLMKEWNADVVAHKTFKMTPRACFFRG